MTDRENPKCPYCGNEMKAAILEERGIFFGEYQCRACQAYAPNAYGFKTFREALEAAYEAAMKRPLQKPLTFEELMGRHDGVWYENCIVIEPMMISHEKEFSLVYNENVVIGMLRGCVLNYFKHLELPISGYNKTWRCWTEKPTEEERKAAEWLE